MPAAFRIKSEKGDNIIMRLLEAHIEAQDVARSVALYTKLLPATRLDSWDDGTANAFVFEDGSAFGVWQKGKHGIHNGQGGAHTHFAFQIRPDEYDGYVVLINELGLTPLEHVWENGHKSVYFYDYDGHQGEFMTRDWLVR